MHNKHNILPYIAAVISSTIFGLSFLFSKQALAVASPLMLVAFRFLLAFIIMTLLLLLKVIKVDYRNKPIGQLLILGLAEPVVYFIFETYGIKLTSSSIAGLMLSLIPIAVTVLGAYFLKEIPSLKRILFIITSVGGVALIGVMDNSGGGESSLWGILLILGAVTCAGVYSIISRKASKHFNAVEITYSMMVLGALFFNIVYIIELIVHGKISTYFEPLKSTTFIISIIYLGVLSSIVAYFLTNYTLSKLHASRSSVFSNISTIVSIAAGVLILKESFQIYHLIGSGFILAGVWGTNRFK